MAGRNRTKVQYKMNGAERCDYVLHLEISGSSRAVQMAVSKYKVGSTMPSTRSNEGEDSN